MGGGKVFADDKVVVTQPEKGEFKAFSAVCTHAGCLVSGVKDSVITCDCHGSRFSTGHQGAALCRHRGRRRPPPADLTAPPAGMRTAPCRVRLASETVGGRGRRRDGAVR